MRCLPRSWLSGGDNKLFAEVAEGLQLALSSRYPISTTSTMPLRRLLHIYNKLREMHNGSAS